MRFKLLYLYNIKWWLIYLNNLIKSTLHVCSFRRESERGQRKTVREVEGEGKNAGSVKEKLYRESRLQNISESSFLKMFFTKCKRGNQSNLTWLLITNSVMC